MRLRIGELIRIKTKEELLQQGLQEEETGDLYCANNRDAITENMLHTLGKVYCIKGIYRNSIFIDETQLNYYESWVELLNTPAAKLLFKR